MHSDLSHWLATVEAVHPNPYAKVDQSTFAKALSAAAEALPEQADPLEFYAVVQGLASLLRDSHTRARFPERSRAYEEAWWPLALAVRDGQLFVRDTQGELGKGSQVTEISGWSAAALLQAGARLTNAELPEATLLQAPWSLGVVLWRAGVKSPFRVSARSTQGTALSAQIAGVVPLARAAEAEPVAYELDWSGGAPRLVIRAMSDVAGFEQFIAETTAKLVERDASGLVVDLRENSGGSTEVGDLLLERITDKPFRQVAAKFWRVSRQYQARVDGNQEYLEAAPGKLLHYRWRATPPREVSPRFLGRVCYLIGPETYSSAMMLANAVEDYDLGMLIGEPTSSPPNYFGEVYPFELPLTRLPVQSSVAAFVRANGDASDSNPVLPGIRVRPTLEQWARGDDPVLERAFEYLRSGE